MFQKRRTSPIGTSHRQSALQPVSPNPLLLSTKFWATLLPRDVTPPCLAVGTSHRQSALQPVSPNPLLLSTKFWATPLPRDVTPLAWLWASLTASRHCNQCPQTPYYYLLSSGPLLYQPNPLGQRNAELVTSLGYHVARGDGDKAARAQADRRDGRDAPAGRAQSTRVASKPP